MNRRLKRMCSEPFSVVIAGDRGTGKSSVFALIIESYQKAGYKCYCQYPYEGCYQIPMRKERINGVDKSVIDKNWLYTANLSHSCVLIDEAKTVWPARGWSKWGQDDDEFFDFIRKNDTHIFMATQSYDALDLNVRRASDQSWYMTLGFLHFSVIEVSKTVQVKVADKNTEVIGRMFRSGARKVVWDICEIPLGTYRFWRKSYYGKFLTLHTFDEKEERPVPLWNELIDFEKLRAKK